MNHWKKAFTLLELLVVIGIIAILVALGAVSYSTAQKKARDAKRKGDVSSFAKCMEQYYSDNNNFKYPANVANGTIAAATTYNCNNAGTVTFKLSPDPINAAPYQYILSNVAADKSTYTLCANQLETESGATFCVSNAQ